MADQNFMRYLEGYSQSFNPYGAGPKVYGSGRSAPNIGPTRRPEAYEERDRKGKAMRNAALKRLKAGQRGRFMSEEYLKPKEDYRGISGR